MTAPNIQHLDQNILVFNLYRHDMVKTLGANEIFGKLLCKQFFATKFPVVFSPHRGIFPQGPRSRREQYVHNLHFFSRCCG